MPERLLHSILADSLLNQRIEKRDAYKPRRRLQVPVERGKRKFLPQGQFQVRGIIDPEMTGARQRQNLLAQPNGWAAVDSYRQPSQKLQKFGLLRSDFKWPEGRRHRRTSPQRVNT